MKKMKAQLKTISKSLVSLSKQVDRLTKQVDKLQPAPKKAAPKKMAAKRKTVARKTVAKKRAPAKTRKRTPAKVTRKAPAKKAPTVLDSVHNVIKRSRSGVTIATLKSKTKLDSRQLSNALYKLSKKGLVRAKSRGVYVKK
jgi:predicted Rossmann fold nucleotide-binding protein DprA/Smf involved in DNA uptake